MRCKPNTLVRGWQFSIDLQAQCDGLSNPIHKFVQGPSLSVTSPQLRNAHYVVSCFVALPTDMNLRPGAYFIFSGKTSCLGSGSVSPDAPNPISRSGRFTSL